MKKLFITLGNGGKFPIDSLEIKKDETRPYVTFEVHAAGAAEPTFEYALGHYIDHGGKFTVSVEDE